MLKRIVNLLEDKSLYIAILLTLLIAYLSFISLNKIIPKLEFGYFDKIAHLISYLSLSFSWFLALCLKNESNLKTIIIVLSITIYGIIIEIIQGNYTPNREADFYDVLANTIGVLIGLVLFILWIQKRKVLK
ncbi:MAG: VanZ family protein [Flavobacteriaceae bacterium]|nr:VanZ family protein [Flavobacteriaceae bacterium]